MSAIFAVLHSITHHHTFILITIKYTIVFVVSVRIKSLLLNIDALPHFMAVMDINLKSFQVGIYFDRVDRSVIARIHPLFEIKLAYGTTLCWGVNSGGLVEAFDPRDLELQSTVTLTFESELYIQKDRQEISDTWAKYNAIARMMKERKQSRDRELIPIHKHKNVHDGGSPPS